MADGHTIRKLWHEGYSSVVHIKDRNPLYLAMKKYHLSTQPNKSHSCSQLKRKINEENDWLAFLLSFGLKQTSANPNQMTDLGNNNRLITLAKLDDSSVPFSFPKSVAVMNNGQIAVCDAGNNRVMGFNSGGIQTFVFDRYSIGNELFPLATPLSICVLANIYFAVTNYGSSIINILDQRGTNESIFICQSRPICLSSDNYNVLYVLTESQTIECYSMFGERITILQVIDGKKRFFTLIASNKEQNEIYLSESYSNEILVINKNGFPLRNMILDIVGSGLNVFITSIQYVNNRILVADSVNRSIFLFDSTNGKHEDILLNGRSGLGSVQTVCLSVENQLITSEYSITQPHCVKIFSCSTKLNRFLV